MRKPTLRLTITFTLATMTLAASFLITWFSYQNSSRTMVDSSQKLMAQVSSRVEEKTANYLGLVNDTVLSFRAMGRAGQLRADDLEAVEALYFGLMNTHPQLSSLDFSNGTGTFLMVKRMDDGSLASKVLRRDGDKVDSVWKSRAPGARLDEVLSAEHKNKDIYDPRTRPWYVGATTRDGIFWSDVHAFYPNKEPEITASIALSDDASQGTRVFGASVTLQGLSDFLSSIKLGNRTRVFIGDVRGRVIAFPRISDWLEVSNQEIILPRIGKMQIPEMNALAEAPAFQEVQTSGQTVASLQLEIAGDNWLGTLQPLGYQLEDGWFIGILMSESELLGQIKEGTRNTLILILVVMVLAVILAAVIGRSISRPLQEITLETARIRDLDFSQGPPRDSAFSEIAAVFSAYDELRIGLRAFEKFVPIRLVQQLLESRREARLGGELRELTLFFSDIRSFSTTAEALPAADLAQWLGDYLGKLAEAVDAHEGTVDKFIGDAVMAFWNAPRQVEDHAYKAVMAAFSCLTAVEGMADTERLYTRIGIHTGEVLVGNFGSPDRLNYTVIGDGVNLASRMEAVNKLYGTQILITRDTYEQLDGRIDCRHLDRIAVKGKAQATDIYEPLGPAGSVDTSRLKAARRYEEGFEHYLAGHFDSALEVFKGLLADNPDDTATQVMAERTENLLKSPPVENWSGVYEMLTK